MAKVTYQVFDESIRFIKDVEQYSEKDLNLIENFSINKKFDYNRHYIETHIYSMNNVRLSSIYDYTLPIPPGGDASEEDKVNELSIDPAQIAAEYGFTRSGVKIIFHFLNDLFTNASGKQELYINSISDDRTEVLLYSDQLSINQIINKSEELKELLDSESYFDEFWLNVGDNDLFIITNIGSWQIEDKTTIALKLYEPLPEKYDIKDIAQIVQKVSDSVAVQVIPTVEEPPVPTSKLRGPNFAVDTEDLTADPTKYFTYNDLFSFSNTNSNRELFSLVKEKGIDLGIDYSNYSNFIHFSSVEERLKNFQYKVQLIETYQSDLDSQLSSSTSGSVVTSGSIAATENLMQGVIENFDHYERFLYYESSSYAWPKSTTTKPHINLHSTSSAATTWYNAQLVSASNFDVQNYDLLTNFLPSYVIDDSNNNNGVLFTHMLGQFFDNQWIYSKSVTEKYNTDHRLDIGLAKDLVKEAVKSMGVKVYNSVEGVNNLFNYFINDAYDSGSEGEVINTFVSTSRPTLSTKDYEAEIYKRVYHNIPLLIKSKGTHRGLRALINCFGIPSTSLKIRSYGGSSRSSASNLYLADERSVTGSIDNISIKAPSTDDKPSRDGLVLSKDTSIQLETPKGVNPSIHRLEVGYSPSDQVNNEIRGYTTGSNLDDLIGDPRDLNKHVYESSTFTSGSYTLQSIREEILNSGGSGTKHNLKDFVRIFKFIDNTLFKMVKDFVPVRTTLDTGIIFKPHVLERNKIKSPSLSGQDETYSGSIDTAFVTGSDGGAYNTLPIIENKVLSEIEKKWKPGKVGGYSDLQFKANLRTDTAQGDPGELVVEGEDFYHPDGTYYNIREIFISNTQRGLIASKHVITPYGENTGSSDLFYVMFSTESIFTRFPILDNAQNPGTGSLRESLNHSHLIAVDYSPHGQNSWVARGNAPANSSSFSPRTTDVLVAAFQTTGSDFGINEERHRFFQSLAGYVINSPVTASTRVVFQTGSGAILDNLIGLTGSNAQGQDVKIQFSGDAPGGTGWASDVNFHTSGSTADTAAKKAQNFFNVITGSSAFGNTHNSGITASIATTVVTNDTVILMQRNAGIHQNYPVAIPAAAYTNGILNPNYIVPSFSGGQDNFKTYSRINHTTFYHENITTKSGSVGKNIGDESPKFTGELSGSQILISDGELNKPNPFKKPSNAVTLFDITAVSQSTADLLNPIRVVNGASIPQTDGGNNDPTEFQTTASACLYGPIAFSQGDLKIFYHDGANLGPVNGDVLYVDINGTTPVSAVENNDFISYWVETPGNVLTNFTAQVSQSDGTIHNIVSCSVVDNIAPTGYSASFAASSVNAGNVTYVPVSADNLEGGTILIASASDQSGNLVTKTITLGQSQTDIAFGMNLTTLDDAENVDLVLRLRDLGGNLGPPAAVLVQQGHFGHTIPKLVSLPSGYTGRFGIAEAGTLNFATQSVNYTARYKVIVHYPPTFEGEVQVTFDGSHAGASPVTNTTTVTSNSITPGTASILLFDDNSAYGTTNYQVSNTGSAGSGFTSNNPGNTVYAYTRLVDQFGNPGTTYHTASVTYDPYIFDFYNADTGSTNVVTVGPSVTNHQFIFRIDSRNANSEYIVTESAPQSWASQQTAESYPNNINAVGIGNTFLSVFVNTNSTGNNRSVFYNLVKTNTQDNFTYTFPSIAGRSTTATLTQTATCVAPETEILMKTGKTKPVKDIKVGDVIRSNHEVTHELLEDIVIKTETIHDAPRVKITLENGNHLICTADHRIYDDASKTYIAVQYLNIGDVVSESKIIDHEIYETGTVVKITTEKTHTYISNGILSHNTK